MAENLRSVFQIGILFVDIRFNYLLVGDVGCNKHHFVNFTVWIFDGVVISEEPNL